MNCTICNSFRRGKYPDLDVKRSSLAFSDLKNSALSCECCEAILEGCCGLLDKLGLGPDVASFDLWLAYEGEGEERDCAKLVTLKWQDGKELVVEFFVPEGDGDACPESWVDMPRSSRTTGDTGSDEAFEKIKSWLESCIGEDHEFCGSDVEQELPTRVVDVGLGDGIVKLVETHGRLGQYVTLSHCWGKEQIITTTTETYEARRKGISEEELSKTFSAAIELTRRLGISYIWIDSLCIVQNDKNDWAREASRMAPCYQKSTLTIAATRSSSGRGGLSTSTPDFLVTGMTHNEDPYRMVFRERIEHELMDGTGPGQFEKFPLLTRAWILQERLLSPRVVHFGPQELFFECNSEVTCECGEIAGYEVASPIPKLTYAEALDADDETRIPRAWRAIVGLYTALSITVKSDRLPAIGGLARQMASVRSSRYIAGLWEDSLIDDMIWMSGPSGMRVSPWRAPSWSWASIEHSVSYDDAPIWWADGAADAASGEVKHFIAIRGWECTPAAMDEFGELQAGVLRVTGRCLEGTVHYGPPDTQETAGVQLRWPRKMAYLVRLAGGGAHEITPDYDLGEEGLGFITTRTRIACLLVSLRTEFSLNGPMKLLYSLVLRPSGSSANVFERIGLFLLREKQGDDIETALDLYFHSERVEITLI